MSGRDWIDPVAAMTQGVVVGELAALAPDGGTVLVLHPLATAAVHARSVVDLRGTDIGRQVVLMFEQGNGSRPIVMGLLQGQPGCSIDMPKGEVDLTADGQRLILQAREQLVLRCGKACITLTRAGKVLIEGSYVLSRSTGVNRIKGGSVQLN